MSVAHVSGATSSVRPAAELRAGRPVVVGSDEGCVLVLLAERATSSSVAFLIRNGSGFLVVAMGPSELARLNIPEMAHDRGGPSFHVAVDAAEGISTGISARDRARTLSVLADAQAEPAALIRPGHVVTVRVDLDDRLSPPSRFRSASMMCAIAARPGAAAAAIDLESPDGLRTASASEGAEFARRHGLAFLPRAQVTRLWYQSGLARMEPTIGV